MTLMDGGARFAGADAAAEADTAARPVNRLEAARPIQASTPARASMALARIDFHLRGDAARRLQRALLRMERFLAREESQSQGDDDPTRVLGQTLADEARRLLRGALRDDAARRIAETTLRSAYRLCGTLDNLAAWSAPASQESHALNSFPVAAQRDVVAYSRYGCAETAAQEAAYTAMLGIDPAHARLLLTSSGMTAYSLIENFLLRDVLRPGDRIVLHPNVYFETQHQLKSLPHFKVDVATGGGRADILQAIVRDRPKVVFVDPLMNCADFRVIDALQLLDEVERCCTEEIFFVIDGTLLSGAFDPFAGRRRGKVRVLYYESGCKYLQFGMDLGPAGLVVVATELAERFERLRRGIGAVAAETLILPRASREVYLSFLRLQTECAHAVAAAAAQCLVALHSSVITALFPSQPEHPDHAEARCYPHLGGVLVFRFADSSLNRRQPLEAFIDGLLAEAREQGIALTAGVSFGFRVPRISAAWASYDAEDAFLRLSAGVDAERAAQLGRLIVQCAAAFIPPSLPE